MTLNANYSGARVPAARSKLEGSERALDALIGLVILIAELLIGALLIGALSVFSDDNPFSDANEVGFTIAVVGSVIVVGISTLIYLIRVASGRRSWRAPLWGLILMIVAVVIGLLIMSSAL